MKLYNNPLQFSASIFRPLWLQKLTILSQKTLPVIRPLVFQPLLVLLDTANLLPVVIWDGVTETLEGRIDAILFDVLEEFPLSLCSISTSPVHSLYSLHSLLLLLLHPSKRNSGRATYLVNLSHNPPLYHRKSTTPQNRPGKPPQRPTANGSNAKEDYRIHAHYHLRWVDLFVGKVADACSRADGAGED